MGGLLAEIDSLAGGLLYHAIAAEIPLDIAPKTLFGEVKGESGSELESKSKPLVSGSGSELWGFAGVRYLLISVTVRCLLGG